MPFSWWREKNRLIDRALNSFLPDATTYPPKIHEAMRYSVFAGGKRVRPVLLLLITELCNGHRQRALPPACALELIHTYSLIHDDLPAMDDDDYRRGNPTAHRVFGEAVAILSGDALLTQAFTLLCGNTQDNEFGQAYKQEVSPIVKLQIIAEIAGASGAGGMVAGQILDLEAEGKTIGLDMLDQINIHKTGALIIAAVRSGALLGGASSKDIQHLSVYASLLGRGFQIVDDLLDVEGNEDKMGKKKGMDQRRKKATTVSLCGVEAAKSQRDRLYNEAIAKLSHFGERAGELQQLTRFLFYRDY